MAVPPPPPPNAPPIAPSSSVAPGDLYQRLQAEREARQAAKDAQDAQASPTTVAAVGSGLIGPALLIGLAVVGVLIFTRKK